jgi:hypothetical protein
MYSKAIRVFLGELDIKPDVSGLAVARAPLARGQPSGAGVRVGDFVDLERPRGGLPWEQKNLHPRKDTGSNVVLVVAGTGFEPVTSGL